MNKEKTIREFVDLDLDKQVEMISATLRSMLRDKLHRRGLVIAMSGGIDSSVSAALAVKAIGKSKVFGLLLPEKDSSSEVTSRGKVLADYLGIEYLEQNIASTLDAIGCYKWRDDAIKEVFPQYDSKNWKNKIVISGGDEGKINHFNLVVQTPEGEIKENRLGLKQYLQIVAATNYKQRIRKSIEYFHADRLNYAVVGTPNRLEYDQGFFVKNGDGSADVKPIAHLFKTQVYDLAKHMGLPEDICNAVPTTDTYSLQQGQDEFYFSLPYQQMDIALWCYINGKSTAEMGAFIGLSEEKAKYIYKDIEAKRKATQYMHMAPLLMEDVKLV